MAQLANLTTTLAIESASFVNGIEQSRGAVQRLLKQLDPAAAATVKFKREMDLLERGLKDGVLTNELYSQSVARLTERYGANVSGAAKVTGQNGMMRAGMQQLGYQLGDMSQGFAMGTSAVTIFAQQSGQTIQALQLMTGEAKGVLAVLGGPWGAILAAALVAVTPFVAKLFEGNDALADQVKKLQDNAAKQAIAAEANRVFAGTQAGLDQRIRETTNSINQQNASLRTNAELQNIKAKQEYQDALKKLGDAQSAAAAATARVNQLSTPGATDPRLAGAKQDAIDSLEAARKAASDAQKSVDQTSQAVIRSRVALAAEQAAADAAANTRTGKITKQYDDQIKAIKLKAAASAQAGKDMSVDEYTQIKNLELEKQAALDAVKTEASARSKALREGRAEARAAQREAVKDAKATADLIASASAGAYKATADLVGDRNKAFLKGFNADATEWDTIAKRAANMHKAQQDIEVADERDLQRVREQHLRRLGDLYYDLFTGGTKRLWQDFERQGFDVLSKLLARWTMNAASPGAGGGGGGGLFGWIGKALGLAGSVGGSVSGWLNGGSTAGLGFGGSYTSIPGFATGGSFQFGGRDGIDKNILSLNGSPIAKVSRGETATIGRGRGVNDNPPIVIHIVGEEGAAFVPRVAAISGASAVQVVGAAQKVQAKQAGRRLGR